MKIVWPFKFTRMNTTQKTAAIFGLITCAVGASSTVPVVSFAAIVPLGFAVYSYLKAENV